MVYVRKVPLENTIEEWAEILSKKPMTDGDAIVRVLVSRFFDDFHLIPETLDLVEDYVGLELRLEFIRKAIQLDEDLQKVLFQINRDF